MAPRPLRVLLAALVTAAVAVPTSAAASPNAVPAPAPTAPAPVPAATPEALAARYGATRADVLAAAATAEDHGDRRRAASLRALADPARHLLSFDGRDGGRSVEVFGDLAGAERIAVLVPGSDTTLDLYGRFRGGATRLATELGGGSAVVAWLGYRTPATVSLPAVTAGRADTAAPDLRAFVQELAAARPGATISLLCHSYGSVVCARAAADLPVKDIVLYGSPGTGFPAAAALRTPATVWAGRGADDWIDRVPDLAIRLPFVTVGFGADPVSPAFGARIFDAGDADHSGYLRAGSVSLRAMARIVAGGSVSPGSPAGAAR
ncbi:alpha/beta hydrolase [Longispora sp. NPDC051575]|uniref:alpha/beta hydrolase n=1 Tax=Longispora sp. NPDC051575 TaxID=3154943 RepID=UPI0034195AF5